MNLKLLGIVVLVCIAGVSIYFTSVNPPQNHSISYFEENRKCFDSKRIVQEEIKLANTEYWDERFIEIFYSPRYDSCLYVAEINSDTWKPLKRLMDYKAVAGGEPIDSCEYILSDFSYEMELEKRREMKINTELIESTYKNVLRDNCARFDESVKRLKNEE